MNRLFYILFAAGAVFSAACTKVTTECSYALQPTIERTEIVRGEDDKLTAVAETVAAEGVVAHIFHADTSLYEVGSYADAEAGVMHSRTGGADIAAAQTVQQDAAGQITFAAVTVKKAVIVLCYASDPEKIYAWREVDVPDNLSMVTMTMTARPYKSGAYADAKWAYENEEPSIQPEVMPECKYVLTPSIERTVIGEDGQGAPTATVQKSVATGVVAHVFETTASLHKVGSYADAVAGVMRSSSDGEDLSASQTVRQDAEGKITLGPVTVKKVVIVLCYGDDPEKIYAWREMDVPVNTPQVLQAMTALPYKAEEYTESQWTFVNEAPSTEPQLPPKEEEGGDSGA
ncbi:hypothetical protein LJC45_04015 [Alistipes sp. OttesenSCG-928-B03]|nr:hypothetical protein [Alistipes sp. OttesenSCG-928-B03]